MRPSSAFASAFGFYYNTVGETVAATLANAEAAQWSNAHNGHFKIIYRSLIRADARHWEGYWERRLRQRGLNPEAVKKSLRAVTAQVSQGERWQCLRMHLNAVPTNRRLRFVNGVDGDHACYLCGAGLDSQLHIFESCTAVRALKEKLAEDGVDMGQISYRQHCLDAGVDTAQVGLIMKLNEVALTLRRLACSHAFHSIDDLVRHGLLLFRFQSLRSGGHAPAGQRRQRGAPPRPLVRPDFSLYRAEGISSTHGGQGRRCGWGVVAFGHATNLRDPTPTERAWHYEGIRATTNTTAFAAVVAAFEHAISRNILNVCVQTGSLLAARQANSQWACKAEHLQAPLLTIMRQVRTIEERGGKAIIEHVHRRYNTEATELARRAITLRTSRAWA